MDHSEDDEEASSSSSTMQTMVEVDEEGVTGVSRSAGAAAGTADSKKRKEERDFDLLCPRLCGASWGPRGELVMFNNFPALTHYIQQTKQQRRLIATRKQHPATADQLDEKTDGARSSTALPTHHRHTSFMQHEHDEDEWDDINQADIGPTPAPPRPAASSITTIAHQPSIITTAEQGEQEDQQPDRTMEVFPPRTFGHLLQLPFLASYLEPVIREATASENGGGARAVIRVARTDDHGGVDTDAMGMSTVSLGAALAGDQSAADSGSDSDDEHIVNLNATSLSSLGTFSASVGQQRTPVRAASGSPSSTTSTPEGSPSPTHSPEPSIGTSRSATASTPLRPSSPSLLPFGMTASSPFLRTVAVVGSGRHDKQLASSSIVALPVHTGVMITDLSCLFPVDPSLSASYPLLPPAGSSSIGTASEMCAAFKVVCERHGRHDLVQLWQLAALVFRPALLDEQQQLAEQAEGIADWSDGWGGGAWTGRLIQRLMSDCWQQGDIESVGLIACLLSFVPRSYALATHITISASYQPFVPPLLPPSPTPALSGSPMGRSLSSQLLRPAFPTRSLSAFPLHLSPAAGMLPAPMLRSHSGNSDGAHDRSPLSASSSHSFPFASTSLPNTSSYPTLPTQAAYSPSFGPASPLLLTHSPVSATSPHQPAATAAAGVLCVVVGVCDLYKLLYAEWLSRLGLMVHRAAVLKCCDVEQSSDALELLTGWNTNELRVGFDAVCQRCKQPLPQQSHGHGGKSIGSVVSSPVRCPSCNVYSAHCAVCHLSVRGLSSYCLQCGHGGHMSHMQAWFESGEKECATGCGCLCSI